MNETSSIPSASLTLYLLSTFLSLDSLAREGLFLAVILDERIKRGWKYKVAHCFCQLTENSMRPFDATCRLFAGPICSWPVSPRPRVANVSRWSPPPPAMHFCRLRIPPFSTRYYQSSCGILLSERTTQYERLVTNWRLVNNWLPRSTKPQESGDYKFPRIPNQACLLWQRVARSTATSVVNLRTIRDIFSCEKFYTRGFAHMCDG